MHTRLEAGFHVKHGNEDDLLVHHSEDVEPTIDYCRSMRGITQRHNKSGRRMVASIPPTIYYEWVRTGITRDQRKLRQSIEAYKRFKCVDDKIWIPAKAQKRIYKETREIK